MLNIKLIRDLITQALSEGKNFKNGIPEIENIYDDNFQWVKENAINTDLRLSELENNKKAYFFGIDTTKLLVNSTQVTPSTPFTWTATENCFVRVGLISIGSKTSTLMIDNVTVVFNYTNDNSASALTQIWQTVPLCKGQVVKLATTNNMYYPTIAVYGVRKEVNE